MSEPRFELDPFGNRIYAGSKPPPPSGCSNAFAYLLYVAFIGAHVHLILTTIRDNPLRRWWHYPIVVVALVSVFFVGRFFVRLMKRILSRLIAWCKKQRKALRESPNRIWR